MAFDKVICASTNNKILGYKKLGLGLIRRHKSYSFICKNSLYNTSNSQHIPTKQ